MPLAPPPEEGDVVDLPTGPGAAAILAAAIGCFVFGVLAFTGDASPPFKAAMNLWKPSGPLSGVSTIAIGAWLVSWAGLAAMWGRREISLRPVNITAFALLLGGLLLTFPPFMDLLQGK